MRNRVWFFGVFTLFLCVNLVDYFIKADRNVSIVGHLQYAAFMGPLIVSSLFALRTSDLLFHRVFAVYSVLALLAMNVATLAPLAN